jgi:predicted RNA-binding Zn ribbon-like protein
LAGQTGLLDSALVLRLADAVSAPVAKRALRSAHQLREALAAVLYAQAEQRTPAPVELQGLEACLRESESPRQLTWAAAELGGQSHFQWTWSADQVSAPAFPVWLMAQSASQLLLSVDFERVHACGAESCRWLFLDTSKNHTRRWCNMKVCGNRAKARRFQERRVQ